MHETPALAAGHTLQSWKCGWTKITSTKGLKIHQGKRRCLRKGEQGTRIDSYFHRSKSSQLKEVKQQVPHITVCKTLTSLFLRSRKETQEPNPNHSSPAVEEKIKGQRPSVK